MLFQRHVSRPAPSNSSLGAIGIVSLNQSNDATLVVAAACVDAVAYIPTFAPSSPFMFPALPMSVHVTLSGEYCARTDTPSVDTSLMWNVVGNVPGSTPVALPSAAGVLLSSLNASKRRPPLYTMPVLMNAPSSR